MTAAQSSIGARAITNPGLRISGQKRKSAQISQPAPPRVPIDADFIAKCEAAYNRDPRNEGMRNVITMVGADIACTSDARSQKITHQFAVTHRTPHYNATNQGHSGRCWMFAGMNILRPYLMKKLDSQKNIKFSGTYLFFWDKFERSRTFLLRILDTLDLEDDDRYLTGLLEVASEDGGYFEYFANLVTKYGLVPETAMSETALSSFSSEMNDLLEQRLKSCAFIIRRDRDKMSDDDRKEMVEATLISIYSDLVKCLGTPPKSFDFPVYTEEHEWKKAKGITPLEFLEICTPDVEFEEGVPTPFSFDDLICLTNLPHLEVNKLYEIDRSTNIYEGRTVRFLNVNAADFEHYMIQQLGYTPVWMACDVGKNLSWFHAAIDPELVDLARAFDPIPALTKGERLKARVLGSTHAMTITGFEVDKNADTNKIKMSGLEIENSWGYYDEDVPGLDGFLYMSERGFREVCTMTVVFKQLLPVSMQRALNSKPVVLPYWSVTADALRVPGTVPAMVTARHQRMTSARRARV